MPRFTPDFLDELKARLRPSDVIGRKLKLKKQGNEWVALSPFTKEKSPSFFVNDQKGFYHCFSSGKHGDIINFLQEVDKLSFAEAVELLAEEAGLQIPEDRPGDAEASEKRKGLIEASEAAAAFFQSMLRRAPGRVATDYLKGRGVSEEQIEQFRIGYAPGERTALKDYLINKGFAEPVLIEAGLLIKPEDGGASYDRFRNRVMFPILGAKDAVIAFGGRALDKDARAKYLNSPETPLFHKGAVLYNYAHARAASSETAKPLIVCEGYMDVVALWGAGFKSAVAPLGTALTENQLALLWRQSDEPALCFDGDKAGLGAAYRAIDRALPLLKPGKSLSFAFLPQGQDPDDVIRGGGAGAFEAALADARSLADVLWRREQEASDLGTPEKRAGLRTRLRALVAGIADKDVRHAYGVEIANRLRDFYRPVTARTGEAIPRNALGFARRRRYKDESQRLFHEARQTPGLRQAQANLTAFLRGATLVLAIINHPGLIQRREEAILGLDIENPDLDELLGLILGMDLADPALDSDRLKAHLHGTPAAGTLQRILSDETLIIQRFLRPGAELDEVDWGWSDALRHHLLATSAKREVASSASQTFSDGEEVWKAAVLAREELFNSGDLAERMDSQGEAKTGDLNERLETMRASVSARRPGRKPTH
jgi:DNA primase